MDRSPYLLRGLRPLTEHEQDAEADHKPAEPRPVERPCEEVAGQSLI